MRARFYLTTSACDLAAVLVYGRGIANDFTTQREAHRVAREVLALPTYDVWHQDAKGRNRRKAEVVRCAGCGTYVPAGDHLEAPDVTVYRGGASARYCTRDCYRQNARVEDRPTTRCEACEKPGPVGALSDLCPVCEDDVALHTAALEGVDLVLPAARLCPVCERETGSDLPGWSLCAECRQHEARLTSLARLGAFVVPVMDRDLGVADGLTGAAS